MGCPKIYFRKSGGTATAKWMIEHGWMLKTTNFVGSLFFTWHDPRPSIRFNYIQTGILQLTSGFIPICALYSLPSFLDTQISLKFHWSSGRYAALGVPFRHYCGNSSWHKFLLGSRERWREQDHLPVLLWHCTAATVELGSKSVAHKASWHDSCHPIVGHQFLTHTQCVKIASFQKGVEGHRCFPRSTPQRYTVERGRPEPRDGTFRQIRSCAIPLINGNLRILKWRYCTI